VEILERYRPKALIFDFDGTVVDSMPFLNAQLHDFISERDLVFDDEVYHSFLVMGLDGLGAYLHERFGLTEPAEEITRLLFEEELELYRTDIGFVSGAREFLEKARTRGLPLGLATSSPRPLIGSFLRAQQAEGLFSALCFSDEIGVSKEHPDIYHATARGLGVDLGDCMIFEDAMPALRTASRTPATLVAVRCADSQQDLDEMEALAELVIDGYRELLL
jgi:HAD superfamily hydrolase (TIGR01509 family)